MKDLLHVNLIDSVIEAAGKPRLTLESQHALSMEAQNEREVEYYIQGVDFDHMDSLSVSKEGQEQWGIFVPKTSENAAEGSVRVRETIKDGEEPVYELTSKLFKEDGTKDEEPEPSTYGQFNAFKLLAHDGMRKTRYFIPTEVAGVQMTLEVDVFAQSVETDKKWVKVDLEFPEGVEIPDKLESIIPFRYTGECVIVTPTDKKEKTEAAKKGWAIAKEVMVCKNVYVGGT